MSTHEEADAINSRAAKAAAWLHSVIDIPAASPTPHEESRDRKHFRIPRTLSGSISKEDYCKYYRPSVVSIGPLHHGQSHVAPMEKFKRKALRELAERVKEYNVSVEQVYVSVEQHLLGARDCYPPRKIIDDDRKWCLMMFLDGCFVIEFISCDNIITSGRRSWLNSMKKRDRDLVWRDLLLLKNQLPFQVLDVLARAFRCKEFTLHLLTKTFLQMPLLNIPSAPTPTFLDYIKGVSPRQHQHQAVHLLQYYRNLWISVLFGDDVVVEEDTNKKEEQAEEDTNKKEDHLAVCPPFSVTELKKVGIRCSCATGRRSILYLSDIHVKSSMLSGKLFLPKLTIDEWTMTFFYNIFAYEYSCSLQNRSFGISSYLSFMSMLINGEEDVKELRVRDIVQLNLEVGDDHVVNFFKDITARIEPNPQAFRRVKRQISTYRKSKCLPLKVVWAEFKHKYFSGPWSFLVFLAVIFTVSMTVIQTVFTGIQTYK